jgi:hypothetical protein
VFSNVSNCAEQRRAQKQLRLRLHGRERAAELGGFFLQVVHRTRAETLGILCGTDIMGWDPVFEQVIDGTGDVVRRRHKGLGRDQVAL